MREAVGGSWLLYIVITFLIIYVVFIAFIMNYASAYRAANYVVTQIENCEADMSHCNGNDFRKIAEDVKNKYKYMGGIDRCCIDNARNGSIYRVTLKVQFEAPLFGMVNAFQVRVDTKTINVSCEQRSTEFQTCASVG